VVYSGSLERIDFGEEGEPKGFCWVELARGKTEWRFVPVQARRFRTIAVDATGADDPTEAVLAQVAVAEPGEVVRVVVNLRDDQQSVFREREVQRTLEAASSVSVVRQVEVGARMRLSEASAEALAPLELVERYLASRQVPADRVEALLAEARALMETT
jgi:exonuclease SbcD